MVEIVRDEGEWIYHRGAFGGSKLRLSRRNRILRVLNTPSENAVAAPSAPT